MRLIYGEHTFEGLAAIKTDGPIIGVGWDRPIAYTEMWTIAGTLRWDLTGCPVLDRLKKNAIRRWVRALAREVGVNQRRESRRRGNHRGRYYKNLNGRTK